MRLFRKKFDSPAHQEYLDGLITSIRRARRVEEEKPDLHAFVEEDNFPTPDGPGRSPVPPAAANIDAESQTEDVEEIANLEAYLSKLNEDEAAEPGEEPGDGEDAESDASS